MIYHYNTLAHSINTFVNVYFNGGNEGDGNRRRKSTPAIKSLNKYYYNDATATGFCLRLHSSGCC